MIDGAEEIADVCVEHVVESAFCFLADLLQRLRRRAAGAKPVRAIAEFDLEDRFQDQLRCCLYDTVAYRRNPERSFLSVCLRNVPTQNRLRSVLVRAQHVAELFKKSLDAVSLDLRDRLGIDARGPLVPSH